MKTNLVRFGPISYSFAATAYVMKHKMGWFDIWRVPENNATNFIRIQLHPSIHFSLNEKLYKVV